MRALLLQDQVFLPSLGGGNKGSRLLLEALCRRGHDCLAIAPAFARRAGPATEEQLARVLDERHASIDRWEPGRFAFRHATVRVEALHPFEAAAVTPFVADCVRTFDPDVILVTDDKPRFLLAAALSAAPDRVVSILQTVVHLPFGPQSAVPSPAYAGLMRSPRTRLVISRFLQDYLAEHGGLDSTVVHLPVYGPGPFLRHGRFHTGRVTMINPCVEKGLPIFLELADRFPDVPFAAVPTWGADGATLEALSRRPNVRIELPADDIDRIFRDTRILLAPSLWPETFGYVVVEAMLRGIPVLAADIGGLPEAKLGVDFLLPVVPAARQGLHFESPNQDVAPWAAALRLLLSDVASYERCGRRSRDAALDFVRTADVSGVERIIAPAALA